MFPLSAKYSHKDNISLLTAIGHLPPVTSGRGLSRNAVRVSHQMNSFEHLARQPRENPPTST